MPPYLRRRAIYAVIRHAMLMSHMICRLRDDMAMLSLRHAIVYAAIRCRR